jgi:RHS repeat-associated protein
LRKHRQPTQLLGLRRPPPRNADRYKQGLAALLIQALLCQSLAFVPLRAVAVEGQACPDPASASNNRRESEKGEPGRDDEGDSSSRLVCYMEGTQQVCIRDTPYVSFSPDTSYTRDEDAMFAAGDSAGNDSVRLDGPGGLAPEENAGYGINFATNDKSLVAADYVGAGPAPLRWIRTYHSNSNAFPAAIRLASGERWHNFYDRSLFQLSDALVRLHRPDGQIVDFVQAGGTWVPAKTAGVLSPGAAGWTYTAPDKSIETYSSTGQLHTISEGGLVTSLLYDGANRLAKVVGPFGQTLVVGYDGANRVATVTLPDNTTITYTYNTVGNLTAATFVDASSRQYFYDNPTFPYALTGYMDETGSWVATGAYDSAGRPSWVLAPRRSALPININYVDRKVILSKSNGARVTRTLTDSPAGPVVASVQTDATASTSATNAAAVRDAAGQVVQATAPSGATQTISRDSRGRPTLVTLAAGTTQALPITQVWHPIFNVVTSSNQGGVTTRRIVDDAGRVTAVTVTGTDGVTQTVMTRYYNAQNLLTTTVDARGGVRTYTYDAAGNRTSTTSAAGLTTLFGEHNAHGQARRITLPSGTVITKAFDVRGRMAQQTVNGLTTSFTYDRASRPLRTTAPDGSWQEVAYDATGQASSVTNHRGETQSVARAADGSSVTHSVADAAGSLALRSKTHFNPLGQVAAYEDSRGYRTQRNYGPDNRPAGSTTPTGQTFGVSLDLLNRPVAYTQPNTTAMRNAGGPATVAAYVGYDPTRATQQSLTDTVTVATGFAVDPFNRPVAEAGADAGARAVVRNAAGDVTSSTDALGATLSISRDNLGRVVAVTPVSGYQGRTFSYVPNQSDSLLASMTDPSGNTAWVYDANGRLLRKVQNVNGTTRMINIERDSLGRPTRMTYPTGMQVGMVYAGAELTGLTVNGSTLLSGISYLPFSTTPKGWTWGNGSTHQRTYDTDGRVKTVTLGSVNRTYNHDVAGRITQYVDSTPSGTVYSNFGYDEAGQLITYSGPQGSFAYSYDTNGNRRSTVRNGYTEALQYQAGSNRLLTSPRGSYTYRADGNPSHDGYLRFNYDPFGMLISRTASDLSVEQDIRSVNAQGMRVRAMTRVWQEGTGVPLKLKDGFMRSSQSRDDGLEAARQAGAPGVPGGPGLAAATSKQAPANLATQASATNGEVASTGGAVRPKGLSIGAVNPLPGDLGTVAGRAPAVRAGWKVLRDTHYLHADDGSLLGEYSPSPGAGQITPGSNEVIWLAGQPVGAMINGTLYAVRSDHLNTPRSMARLSDNLEVWRWDSEPFGSNFPTATAGGLSPNFNLRFPGQQYDNYSGHFYNWMRDYDPYTGRYLQADPIGLQGGLSRYGYVGGDPLGLVDPNGLAPHDYTWRVFRCMGDCTAWTYYELRTNPAPGVSYAQPVTSGSVSTVSVGPLVLGQITTTVDAAAMSITNRTLSDHLLFPGEVTRSVEFDGKATWVVNVGNGDGPLGTLNSALAPFVWGGTSPSRKPELMCPK